jgi:hypothetical protein
MREEASMKGSRENTAWLPKRRTEEVVVEPAGGEILVYDLKPHKVHCLNGAAAEIWRLCDGHHTVEQIAPELKGDLEFSVRESLVRAGLAELSALHLLESGNMAAEDRVSRRDLVKSLGIGAIAAAVAIPLISTIVAPTPAYAQSCLANGRPCTSNAQCCSGLCGAGIGSGNCNTA